MDEKVLINNEDVEKIVNIILKSINPFLIYLFGSAVGNVFRKDSDIDIAFLGDNQISDYDIFMVSQNIADELKRDIDLVDLKKATTVFKAQVVGKGRIIYCSDTYRKMIFEMYALKDYALLNEERAVILDEIKRSGTVYGK